MDRRNWFRTVTPKNSLLWFICHLLSRLYFNIDFAEFSVLDRLRNFELDVSAQFLFHFNRCGDQILISSILNGEDNHLDPLTRKMERYVRRSAFHTSVYSWDRLRSLRVQWLGQTQGWSGQHQRGRAEFGYRNNGLRYLTSWTNWGMKSALNLHTVIYLGGNLRRGSLINGINGRRKKEKKS